MSELLADPLGELHEAVGEAPLVVVPTEDLDLAVNHLSQGRIEDRGVRVANDVVGDDRRLGVLQVSGQRPVIGSLAEGRVDVLDRCRTGGDHGEVGDRADRDRHPHGSASQTPIELGNDQADGPGGPRGGGNDGGGGSTRPTQVLVGRIVKPLVPGVGVDRRHETALDPEGVVEDPGERGQGVRGARSVGEHVGGGDIQLTVVDPQDEGGDVTLGWCGDDDLLGATLKVLGGLVPVNEEPGGLDDDVGPDLTPGDLGRVRLGEDPDGPTGDLEILAVDGDSVEVASHRVPLQESRQRVRVGQVVDGNDLDVRPAGQRGPQIGAPDTSEAVDADTNGHDPSPSVNGGVRGHRRRLVRIRRKRTHRDQEPHQRTRLLHGAAQGRLDRLRHTGLCPAQPRPVRNRPEQQRPSCEPDDPAQGLPADAPATWPYR